MQALADSTRTSYMGSVSLLDLVLVPRVFLHKNQHFNCLNSNSIGNPRATGLPVTRLLSRFIYISISSRIRNTKASNCYTRIGYNQESMLSWL